MANPQPDNPGVIAPPPFIYGGMFLLSLLLHKRRPLRFDPRLPRSIRRLFGASLIGIAGTTVISAVSAMRKQHTNIDPSQPTTALVVEGPFKVSRNPLYLSMTFFFIGLSMLRNTLWTLLLMPITLLIMRKGVIEREERYLTRKFGDQYTQYQTQVRRWI
jgi:protein-S-isoprenylcysteine O-methyltransferase Ste14